MMRAFPFSPFSFLDSPMTIRSPSRFVAALLCASMFAIPPSVQGADKPREASFGKGKGSGPLLARAQLRECFSQQDRVRALGDETVKEQAALSASKGEIDRLSTELQAQLVTLDRTNAEAVAAYNAQVQVREKAIDDYQNGVPAFNEKVETLKSERAAFAKACENRRYDENDEIAIRRGK